MMAGHFGLAATVKASAPKVPLWALMLATQFLDVVFVPLYLARIENADTVGSGGYGGLLIHAVYTHSLVGALVLAALYGAVSWWRWGRDAGLVLAAVVFSHWILDLVVHRPDLPILPGNAGGLPLLGFGLWRSTWASAAVEGVIITIGAVTYYRSLRGRASTPRRAVAAGAVLAGALVLSLVGDLANF